MSNSKQSLIEAEAAKAAQKALDRRKIRKSLSAWSQACGFNPARHHAFIIDKLEKAANGTLVKDGKPVRKLLICLPPGSAKSTYSSKLFPPWFLCVRPNATILTCSHSTNLAENFGRINRNLIELHSKELGYGLAKDSKAAGEWDTNHGSGFFCAGVGSNIAGRRADLGLIDDPIGSKEDADSKAIRDKTWEWYKSDFKTRLKPNAVTILIQTRWHEDDLAGRLLESEKNEWEVINLPLLAEDNDALGRLPGELLWPEYFNDDMVREAKKDARVFSALYQQHPTPESGHFFLSEHVRTYASYDDLPKDLRYYVGSDHAVGEKQENDLTCLLPVGVDSDDNIWILPDVFWKRADSFSVVEEMLRMIKRRRPLTWWAERGHISKAIGPFLRKRMVETTTYCHIEEVVSARDKQSRAQSIHGRMSMGKVRFPAFASWWPDALHQLLTFPAGKNDDFVDALSEIGMGLDKTIRAESSSPPETGHDGSFRPTLSWIKKSHKEKQLEEQRRRDDR